MKRRTFVAVGAALSGSPAWRVFAQSKPLPRICFLSTSTEKAYAGLLAEFRAGLRALGHEEGKTYALDVRWAEDRVDRLAPLIAEAMVLKPSIFVTHGSSGVAELQKATKSVPIVFASAGDPIGQGFVASLARPGGNITGVAFNDEVNTKLYELVKIVMPKAVRVGTLINPENAASKHHLAVVEPSSKALGLEPHVMYATGAKDFDSAFARATASRIQAVIATPMSPFISQRAPLIELQFKHRLPTFWGIENGAREGGVASYSFPFEQNYRRAAALVDKILKGGNPAVIPVELPTQYEVAINLQSAKSLGLVVPEAAVLRANKVIE